jgi:hypothetical protein
MERFSKIVNDKINLQDKQVRGHLIFRDPETKKIIHEQDNLVVMRTRVYLFEHLFGVPAPTYYNCKENNNRIICLFKVGQGGADVNANAFNPYVPKFSDTDLAQPVPFVIVDPDKDADTEEDANPSVVTELTENTYKDGELVSKGQDHQYYLGTTFADGRVLYYGKTFEEDSKGWVIDNNTGEVAYSMNMKIEETECRGCLINEIGLILAEYDEEENVFIDSELATRITFDTESLTSLTKGIEIEYIMYI